MATKYADLFTDLARPFEDWEVKERAGGKGRRLHYVDASTVMNRLDDVLGPEHWSDSYTYFGGACLCTLSVTLPEGETITRSGMGAYLHRSDEELLSDPANLEGYRAKAAQSDALKRAAVHLGVGRYLGKSGVPAFARHAFDEEPAAPAPRAASPPPPPPAAARKRAAAPAPAPAPAAGGDDPTLPPARRPAKPAATEWKTAHTGPGRPAADPNAPRTGRALFGWLKDREEDTEAGLVTALGAWGKTMGFPARVVDWSPEQVARGYAAAVKRLAREHENAGAR